MRPIIVAMIAAVAAGLAHVPASAATKRASQLPDMASITNTGSTNTTGYEVSVFADGACFVEDAASRKFLSPQQAQDRNTHAAREGKLPVAIAHKLFHDLTAAMPLTQLPVTFGMKSVSFGTSTYVTYKGQRTPDLSAPADSREQALKADITAIAAVLNLKNGPRRPVMPLSPSVPGH